MNMTYHCQYERQNRIQNIINTIGLGTVIKKKYQNGCYICITDTGITQIVDELDGKIITMYVTTFRELVRVYGGTKKIPPFLRKKVDHNQSKYTNEGKTIWK